MLLNANSYLVSGATDWLSEKPWQFKWILSPKILCKIPIKK